MKTKGVITPTNLQTRQNRVKSFGRTYRAIPAGPTPLAPIPSEHPRADLIWTRFWPDLDLKSPFSGQKSGPNQVWANVFGEGWAQRGRSSCHGPVGPPKVLKIGLRRRIRRRIRRRRRRGRRGRRRGRWRRGITSWQDQSKFSAKPTPWGRQAPGPSLKHALRNHHLAHVSSTISRSGYLKSDFFIHPHPPTRGNTLLGVGGV